MAWPRLRLRFFCDVLSLNLNVIKIVKITIVLVSSIDEFLKHFYYQQEEGKETKSEDVNFEVDHFKKINANTQV